MFKKADQDTPKKTDSKSKSKFPSMSSLTSNLPSVSSIKSKFTSTTTSISNSASSLSKGLPSIPKIIKSLSQEHLTFNKSSDNDSSTIGSNESKESFLFHIAKKEIDTVLVKNTLYLSNENGACKYDTLNSKGQAVFGYIPADEIGFTIPDEIQDLIEFAYDFNASDIFMKIHNFADKAKLFYKHDSRYKLVLEGVSKDDKIAEEFSSYLEEAEEKSRKNTISRSNSSSEYSDGQSSYNSDLTFNQPPSDLPPDLPPYIPPTVNSTSNLTSSDLPPNLPSFDLPPSDLPPNLPPYIPPTVDSTSNLTSFDLPPPNLPHNLPPYIPPTIDLTSNLTSFDLPPPNLPHNLPPYIPPTVDSTSNLTSSDLSTNLSPYTQDNYDLKITTTFTEEMIPDVIETNLVEQEDNLDPPRRESSPPNSANSTPKPTPPKRRVTVPVNFNIQQNETNELKTNSQKDTTLQRLELILKNYQTERKLEPDHKSSFFCIPLGYSKEEKLSAVRALISSLNGENHSLKEHLPALRNGELGKRIREFVKKEDTSIFLEGDNVDTVTGLVDSLEKKALMAKNFF